MYGFMGKMLFVDLTSNSIEERPLSEELARNFLGGAGLGAKILYDEMPAHTDPFAPGSMIGFVSGALTGSGVFFSGRYMLVSRSPASGGWNDANSGGSFGPDLKKAGYDAVFVKGISEKPVYIWIDNGKAQIRDASKIWHMTTTVAEDALRREIGDKNINIALIGPGGEKMSYMAGVMNDGHRAAGRGGSGAVMGSKKLKAIVVRGNQSIEVFDKEKVRECNRKIRDHMKGPAAELTDDYSFGTNFAFTMLLTAGALGVKNFKGSVQDFPVEEANKIASRTLDRQYKKKKYACFSCPLACGAFYEVDSKELSKTIIPRPEYETTGAFGSMLLNSDPLTIMKCNDLCNEFGLDTISVGGTIAWVFDCYDRGILSQDDLDGIRAEWGNSGAIVALTEKICKGQGCGALLQKGSWKVAEILEKGKERLMGAGGIEQPMIDPRFTPALARTYQYDPTPGRHVKGGRGIFSGFAAPEEKYNFEGTGEADRDGVVKEEIENSAGLCNLGLQVSPEGITRDMIYAVTGFEYTDEEWMRLGLRIYTQRAAFNLREGMRRKDYKISKGSVASDETTKGPLEGIVIDNEKLADNFFDVIGWTRDFVPKKETLEELGGLEPVITDLYPDE